MKTFIAFLFLASVAMHSPAQTDSTYLSGIRAVVDMTVKTVKVTFTANKGGEAQMITTNGVDYPEIGNKKIMVTKGQNEFLIPLKRGSWIVYILIRGKLFFTQKITI